MVPNRDGSSRVEVEEFWVRYPAYAYMYLKTQGLCEEWGSVKEQAAEFWRCGAAISVNQSL